MFCLALLFYWQDSLLYVPSQPFQYMTQNPIGYKNPKDKGITYQDIHLKTSDNVSLHGWLMLTENPKQKDTIVFMHENAGNIGLRLEYFKLLIQLEYNVLCIAYRGYSQSGGKPNEQGIMLDAQAMVDFISKCKQVNPDRLYLLGRSLGGAVALHLISKLDQEDRGRPIFKGVIIENTFTSISDMADELFNFLK